MNLNEVVAIIPARGGSKGLPRKNVLDLCGKPLIAYSIQTALAARSISRVIVSTEDPEIADIARQWGAEVPFLRPEELARDDSPLNEAIVYTLQRLYPRCHNRISTCLLMPTSPFRPAGLVDHLVGRAMRGACVVCTVRRIERPARAAYQACGGQGARPLEASGRFPLYRPYGLVSVGCSPAINPPYVHVIKDEASLIDIDTPEDFRLAEEVLRRGLFSFGEA